MSAIECLSLKNVNDLESPSLGASLCWLGQAGFLLGQGGRRIVIDPYLSDSLAQKYSGTKYPHRRLMPPPIAPGRLKEIDWILCTHAHTDHMDPGTIPQLLEANPGAKVVVPRAERLRALERGVPQSRMVQIDAGESVDLGGAVVTAIPAAHEDLRRGQDGFHFLGYVLSGGGVNLWHSGDSIPWHGQVEWLAPFRIDLALLPINGRDEQRSSNGVPGNFTIEEAVAIADQIGAPAMLGHHFGMFDFNTIEISEAVRRLDKVVHNARVIYAEQSASWVVHPAQRSATSILFVCKGNICRSPLAEAILRHDIPRLNIESAGIENWNTGKVAHPETQRLARAHGFDLTSHRARQVVAADFWNFDLILGMDRENLAALEAMRPYGAKAKLGLLGAYLTPGSPTIIADPWGGDESAFELAHSTIRSSCLQLSQLLASAIQ